MSTLLPNGKQYYETSAGIPLVGGQVFTYDTGTTNPRVTYSDAAGTVPNANPVVLDARGEAVIFWSGAYKVVLKDALNNIIWTVDGLSALDAQTLSSTTSAAGGSGLMGYNFTLAYGAGTIGAYLNNSVGRVADTIAAILALPVRAAGFQAGFALGYYVDGDRGGGPLYYDPTDTVSTANGGTVFLSTSGGAGRWKRPQQLELLDVQFGAHVDGATDDSSFILAMVNSVPNPKQQPCRLVAGTRVASNIVLPAGVWLIGSGKDSCAVNVTDLVNPAFRVASSCRLSGMTISHPNQVSVGVPTVYPPAVTHAVGGCSYATVDNIRLYNAYDGIVFGSNVAGVGGINIRDIDGFPLHIGIQIDSANEICRVEDCTFNPAIVGNIYTPGNTIPGWVFANAIAYRIMRADTGGIDNCLAFGYKRCATFEAGSLTGSANGWVCKNLVADICQAPVETTNYQDGITFIGGSMTSNQGGYLSLTGVAIPLAGGIGVNQCVKFVGVIFRNFYDGVVNCKTNVTFVDCEFYNFNAHNISPVGAIAIGLNGVTVKVIGGRIDGAATSNSRGIDNQTPFTGVTLFVDNVTFSNLGSNAIFAPTGTTLFLGKCLGLGQIFYNGLNITQNNQGEMMVGVIPAAGTWTQDARFIRSSAAVGQPKAYSCTAGGTPGTWVSEGNL